MRSALIYTDAYGRYEYSETHPLKPYRLKLTHELMRGYELLGLPNSRVVQTVPASRQELALFHTPEYLEVLAMADAGVHRQDYRKYGLGPGDNPLFPGMYAWSQLCAGGTLPAERLGCAGEADVAFHLGG